MTEMSAGFVLDGVLGNREDWAGRWVEIGVGLDGAATARSDAFVDCISDDAAA